MEVGELFEQWLQQHYPLKAQRIMQRIRDCRQGKIYDAEFGQRMTGSGEFAELIGGRFSLLVKKLRLNTRQASLDCTRFIVPMNTGHENKRQLSLFD